MNIGSGSKYPAGALSNFSGHAFTIDGVFCASMEGFLQSLKFDKPHIQVEVCKLIGFAAKKRGSKRNKAWKTKQTLWWQGIPIGRKSKVYQTLLDRAYMAMFEQSIKFKKALTATHNATLIHSIGRSKESETVLTEKEFCSRLHKLRDLL